MGHFIGDLVEIMLAVLGMKIAQADGAEALAYQTAEEVAIAAHRARAEFLRAAGQVALLDELGKRQRPFGLRVAAIDRREDVGDKRQHILFRAVIVAVARELLADPASYGCTILDFVPIESQVPTTVSLKYLALLHVLADRPPLRAILSPPTSRISHISPNASMGSDCGIAREFFHRPRIREP